MSLTTLLERGSGSRIRARAIGVCNFRANDLNSLVEQTGHVTAATQIILQWQIELGTSAILKSVRSERIAENIDIFDFALTSEEVQAINALDTGERGGPDPEQVNPQTFSITIQD